MTTDFSKTMFTIGLLAIFALQPSLMSLEAGQWSLEWSASGGIVSIAGLMIIRKVRGKLIVMPFLMIILCMIGMALGLAIDQESLPPGGLQSICREGSPTLWQLIIRHLTLLPAMHGLMLAGGVGTVLVGEWKARTAPGKNCRRAICARAAFNIVCNSAMLFGMILGAWGGAVATGSLTTDWGPAAMMTVMSSGMVWGMVLVMIIYRMIFTFFIDKNLPQVVPLSSKMEKAA